MNHAKVPTLTTRLLRFFMLTLALVLVGFSAILYLLASWYLHRSIGERLGIVLDRLSAAVESDFEGVEWEAASRPLSLGFLSTDEQIVWLVADHEGTMIDHSNIDRVTTFLIETAAELNVPPNRRSRVEWTASHWNAGQRWIYISPDSSRSDLATLPDPNDESRKYPAISLTAGVSRHSIEATLRWLLLSLIGVSVMIWSSVLVVGRLLCRRALEPVRRMALNSKTIGAENLSYRFSTVNSNDELEDLSRAFNQLLERLQDSFERQRRFAGDAAHQLRTPLTAILGQLEVAMRRQRTVDEHRLVLETVHRRASHLAGLVEAMLFLARSDSDTICPEQTAFELPLWLSLRIDNWKEHSRSADFDFECRVPKEVQIVSHTGLLGELIDILLDNACKFSEPGTPIKIRLEPTPMKICLSIEDHGYGIGKSDMEHLFTPFFRSFESHQRGIQGSGLGLAIAKRLSKALKIELDVASKVGEGTCFQILIPRKKIRNATDTGG